MSRNSTARQPRNGPSRTPVRPSMRPGSSRRREALIAGAIAVTVLAALGGLYAIYNSSVSSPSPAPSASGDAAAATHGGPRYPYAVGSPGPGEQAPGFTLASSTGGTISLSDYRGRSVLLYFQEGLMCQPCWDQINDLERNAGKLEAAGIDAVVSITTDPIDLVTQKVRDDDITTPVLSDPDKAVSRAYNTLKYGMMGGERNGHSFILVGPDGAIRWRADYGGPPKYTMYLPTEAILADLRKDLGKR